MLDNTEHDEEAEFVRAWVEESENGPSCIYPRHLPEMFKVTVNSAACSLSSMFDNIQSVRVAASVGVSGFKSMVHKVNRELCEEWRARLLKSLRTKPSDSPGQTASVELAQVARVRTWRPKAYESPPWEKAKEQVIAATVPPTTEAFTMMPEGFIPDAGDDRCGYICVTVIGDPRNCEPGTPLADVPVGKFSPLLYHDRSENYVQGLFRAKGFGFFGFRA